MPPVFVSCDKLPQTWRLQTLHIYSQKVLEVGSPHTVLWQGQFLLGLWRSGVLAFFSSRPPASLDVPSPHHTSLLLPSSRLLLPPFTFLLPLTRTLVIITFGPTWITLAARPISGSFTESHWTSPFCHLKYQPRFLGLGSGSLRGPLLRLPHAFSKILIKMGW